MLRTSALIRALWATTFLNETVPAIICAPSIQVTVPRSIYCLGFCHHVLHQQYWSLLTEHLPMKSAQSTGYAPTTG
ncbi:hypothetical protein F5880DRAFT_267419 [Lentinula raphanica]|nr:hypothetical protein F5880DRAFT_267419 [Lentinula raphanica]